MNQKHECSQCQKTTMLHMNCGHSLCQECFPSSKSIHVRNKIHLCEICSMMSSIEVNEHPTDINLQHVVICSQCLKGPFTMQDFLDGIHRNHSIVTIKKCMNQINNQIFHLSQSISLENQSLYRKVDHLIRQKRKITEKFSVDTNNIKISFIELIQAIKQAQENIIAKYEQNVIEQSELLDKQINNWKQKIDRCENYMKILDSQVKNHLPIQSIEAVDFYLEHHRYLQRFVEELSCTRMHNSFINITENTVNLDEIMEFKETIGRVNVFKIGEEIELSHRDENENYFEKKKKQIFSQSAMTVSFNTTMPTKNNPQIELKNSIDERLDNLRKMINFNRPEQRKRTYLQRIK